MTPNSCPCFPLVFLYNNHPPSLQEVEQKLQSAEKQGGQRPNSGVIASSHENKMSLGGLIMTPHPTPYRPEAVLALHCTLCVQ